MPPVVETISLDQPLPVAFGDEVTFSVVTDEPASTIQLHVYQEDVLVFADSHAAFPGGYGYDDPFTLGPSASWTGGAAEATAMLGHRRKNGRFVVDAQVSFPVTA